MGDYYEFSDKLLNFIEDIKYNIKNKLKSTLKSKKIKLHKTLNLEIVIYKCQHIEINIFTKYLDLYEIFRNKLIENQNELIKLCKYQSYIYSNSTINYNHIVNIKEFEKTQNRDICYNYIVKYYN